MAKRKHKTAKEQVLARYPRAYAYPWAGPAWTIYAETPERITGATGYALGDGKTAALAWADAARRLKGARHAKAK